MMRKILASLFATLALIVVIIDCVVDYEKNSKDPALMSYQIEAIAEEIADHEDRIKELCAELQLLIEEQQGLLEKESRDE